MKRVAIKDLNKADVLATLYNASKPQGMGFLLYDYKPMTHDEAADLLRNNTRFNYVKGRVIKVDLSGNQLNLKTDRYDSFNGKDAAKCAIMEFSKTCNVNSLAIQATHRVNTMESAENIKRLLDGFRNIESGGSADVLYIGPKNVADELYSAVNEVIKKLRACPKDNCR